MRRQLGGGGIAGPSYQSDSAPKWRGGAEGTAQQRRKACERIPVREPQRCFLGLI